MARPAESQRQIDGGPPASLAAAEPEPAFTLLGGTAGLQRLPPLPPSERANVLSQFAVAEASVGLHGSNDCTGVPCGETYLQTELPIDPSSPTRWRARVGEEGVETLLAARPRPPGVAVGCAGVHAQKVIVNTSFVTGAGRRKLALADAMVLPVISE